MPDGIREKHRWPLQEKVFPIEFGLKDVKDLSRSDGRVHPHNLILVEFILA